ncbi:MAG: protein kinase [Proteobacteria bacterium]|nr:protein kinase [Pseudomonadota bacterium]
MDSELESAINNGDETKIKEKLAALNDNEFSDALIYAIKSNNVNVVKLLLNEKLINPDTFGLALVNAVEKGHAEILKILLEDKRPELNHRLQYAFINDDKIINHPEIVRILLEDKRADPYEGIGKFVEWAIRERKTEILALLLNDKRDFSKHVRDLFVKAAIASKNDEIIKLVMEDKRINPALENTEKFFQDAFDNIPNMIFSSEGIHPSKKETSDSEVSFSLSLRDITMVSNNDSYLDQQSTLGARGEPLFLDEQRKKIPIGYNIHLPPSGVEIKNVIVEVYGGYEMKDREKKAFRLGEIDTLHEGLLEKGTAVITLNLPDLLELEVFQGEMSEELNNKIQACIHKFYHTIQFNPQSLHDELAILKNKQMFLYGASFGSINTVLHAQQYPGTFNGYIAHNGVVDPSVDKRSRKFNTHLNTARKEEMDKIDDPVLLMATRADNNVFYKASLSFYEQLSDEQKKKYARLWITNKGNSMPLSEDEKHNKGHFLPTDSKEFADYLETLTQFMEKGPSALPQVSRWRGYKEDIYSDKYDSNATLEDKFIAHALMICKRKGHRNQEDINRSWENDYVPVFNALFFAKIYSFNEYKYENKIKNELLTDEVLINFLKFQTGILKEYFEDNYFVLPKNFDISQTLENTEALNKLREQITQPTKPYNQKKQEYLLSALFQSNPSLMQDETLTSEQRELLDSAKGKLIEARAKERGLIRSVFKETITRALKEEGASLPSLRQQVKDQSETHSRDLLNKDLNEARLNSPEYISELFKNKDSISIRVYDERAETVFYGEGGLLTLTGYNYIRKLQLEAAMGPTGPLKNVYLSPKDHPKLNVPVFIGENSEPICIFEKKSVDSGHFGHVYLGLRVDTGEPCLVKKQAVNEAETKALKAFDRQIEAYAQLETREQYEAQYIYAGQNLKNIIQDDNGVRIELPENNRLNMSLHIATAFKKFHDKGWLHRDLNLENILSNPKTGESNVVDLGFTVKADKDLQYKDSNNVGVGHLLYQPPELLDLSASEYIYNEQTEVYSLGIVLAILNSSKSLEDVNKALESKGIALTDPYHRAYTALQIPEAIKEALPEIFSVQTELSQLIQRMTDPDPIKRPKMSEVCSLLNSLQPTQSLIEKSQGEHKAPLLFSNPLSLTSSSHVAKQEKVTVDTSFWHEPVEPSTHVKPH